MLRNLLIGTGLILVAISFLMEFNFHFFQGMQKDAIGDDVFWKMEAVVAPVSTTLIVMGVLFVILGFYLSRKFKK